MPKIPDCDRCSLYAHNPYLVCAVHPDGIDGDRCMDFRPDSNAKTKEQWQGYSWYGDELIADRLPRYSQSEQTQILDNHPFFTGICPQCRHKFNRNNQIIHYDCPNCGWVDDSV